MKPHQVIIVVLLAAAGGAGADEMRLGVIYQPYEFIVAQDDSRCDDWYHSYGLQFAWDSGGAAGMLAETTYGVSSLEPEMGFDTFLERRSQWLTTLAATASFQIGPVKLGCIYGGGLLYEKYDYSGISKTKYFPAGLLAAQVLVHIGPHAYIACEPRFVPVLGDQPLSYIAEGTLEPGTYDGHDMALGIGIAAGYVF